MTDPDALRRIAHSPTPFSTWLGTVLLFTLFGVIVLAIIGPLPRGSDYEQTRAKKRIENLKTLREETEKTLNTYGWIDKSKGIAHIPITRAMELTVAELAQKKPAAAGPIATPAAQASPAAAGPASPAPAGSPTPAAARPSPQASAPPASPSGQAPTSPSPAAQSSPAAPASSSPAPSQNP